MIPGELGAVLRNQPSSFFDSTVAWTPTILNPLKVKTVKDYLGDAIVQFAGALAFDNANVSQSKADLLKGILGLSDDKSVLGLDISSILWKEALGRQEKLNLVDIAKFRDVYYKQASGGFLNTVANIFGLGNATADEATLLDVAQLAWQATKADIFDRLHVAAKDSLTTVTLKDRSYDPGTAYGENAHVDVFIGKDSAEIITGTSGSNLIYGGRGDDTIKGGKGNILSSAALAMAL